MRVAQQSDSRGVLTGSLRIRSVPAEIPLEEAMRSSVGSVVLNQKNMIVKSAEAVIVGLLKGDPAFFPAYIVVGDGGDLEQTSRVDSGVRNPARLEDSAIRSVVARLPIVSVIDAGADCWRYVAVARPSDAHSPMLNEYGVETQNGLLVSHFITAAADSGRATRFCKTSLEYLVIEWEYCFSLAFLNTTQPSSEDGQTPPQQVFLYSEDLSQVGSLTAEALARAIAGSTDISLLSQSLDGFSATIDVQGDITVLSGTTTGASAVIQLVVI